MYNELRYQAKTYTISEKISKEKNKNSASLPPNFFFFFLKPITEKQQRHAYGKGDDI
jgi:hypothetical protein